MPLDPYLAPRAEALRGLEDVWTNPQASAALQLWSEDPGTWAVPSGVDILDRTIAGPHGSIPVRVYSRSDRTSVGTLLWAHGGGFTAGDIDMLEAHVPSSELCARTGFTVVSVDYRLANGGVRYPVPLDDMYAAWLWASTQGGPEGRAAIGGASAGAALSLGASMRARDDGNRVPDALLLAYPFAHFPAAAPTDEVAAELAALPSAIRVSPIFLESIVLNYVGRISGVPVLAAPGAGDLRAMPPAHIIVSELDDLRASGEMLARQMRDAGGSADLYLAHGMPHGHLDRQTSLAEVDRSLDYFAEALRGI